MTETSTETPDVELASACARRDESPEARAKAEAAFRSLYDRHAKRLIAFLGGRVTPAMLDDVHQEVWTKVWKALPTGFQGGNFRAWVHQIARNTIIDHQRQRGLEPLAEEHNVIDHRSVELAGWAEMERRDALARCLKKLERTNAQIADLIRCRVGGESYEAYCARTGMPPQKAHRAFHAAKEQLKLCVEQITQ